MFHGVEPSCKMFLQNLHGLTKIKKKYLGRKIHGNQIPRNPQGVVAQVSFGLRSPKTWSVRKQEICNTSSIINSVEKWDNII